MMRFSNHSMQCIKTEDEIVNDLFTVKERLEHLPAISDYYADKEIFITGGSGFLGKVLIEKLLRSCSKIKTIYVLLRPKKGKSIDERLKAIIDLPLYAPLRKLMPDVLHKLIPINGDVTEIELGLSKVDIHRMRNVSIIFHSAASVRFDDSLKYAVFMNTRGTREIMKFAESLKNIEVVMHVSTTYSNPKRSVVEEKIYDPVADWRKTIEICEKLDEDVLNCLTLKYSNFMPNTYTFTKNLAEHIVKDYKDKIPLVLFRPSIVISTMKEPFPGWIDNFNGPVGLLVGSGIGITRTMWCNPDNIADFTPVDLCVKGMIIAAWKRAHEPKDLLKVYNCASSGHVDITMCQITDLGKCLSATCPMDKMLWTPGGEITLSFMKNFIRTIFLQLLPAMFIDLMFRIKGQKPFLVKIQRKIYEANLALHYFVSNDWTFKNEQFYSLTQHLKLEDMNDFGFEDYFHHDIILYLRYALIGVKKYLLGDKEENIPKNIIHFKRMKMLDRFVTRIPYMIAFYFIFVKYDLINACRSYF